MDDLGVTGGYGDRGYGVTEVTVTVHSIGYGDSAFNWGYSDSYGDSAFN